MTQPFTTLPDNFSLVSSIRNPLPFDAVPSSELASRHGVYVIYEREPGATPDLTSKHVIYIGKARMQNVGTRCRNHGKALRDRTKATSTGKRMAAYAQSIDHRTDGLHVVVVEVKECSAYLISSVEEFLVEEFGRRHGRLPIANTQGYLTKSAPSSEGSGADSGLDADDSMDGDRSIRDDIFESWVEGADGRALYVQLLDALKEQADRHFLGFVYTGKSEETRELRIRILQTGGGRGFLTISTVRWNRGQKRFDANIKASPGERIEGFDIGATSETTLAGRVSFADDDGLERFVQLVLHVGRNHRCEA